MFLLTKGVHEDHVRRVTGSFFFYQQSDQPKKPSTQAASKASSSTPSVTSGSVGPESPWLLFLSSSSQEQPCAGGLSRSSCSSEELPGFHSPSLPQPSSMFDTGEDFEEFLPAAP